MSKHSSSGAEWDKLRLACLDRDGWVCQDCGKDLAGDDATADHIIPKSMGGHDALDNLRALCRRCNGIRQDRLLVRTSGFNPRWLSGLEG